MKISKNAAVAMHYTLTDDQGTVLDSSAGRDPLAYIQGVGAIIPGLEKEMEGKVVGDKFKVEIAPEEAYGLRDESAVFEVPKANFQGDAELQVGMQVQVQLQSGPQIALVSAIEGEKVTLDMNHPLANLTLHFDVEVTSVREATAEELEHGHVHGPGGHQH